MAGTTPTAMVEPAAGLRFSKMHGAGNDFVVLDLRDGAPPPDAALSRALADRHTGVGCDQILTIEPPRQVAGDGDDGGGRHRDVPDRTALVDGRGRYHDHGGGRRLVVDAPGAASLTACRAPIHGAALHSAA